MAEGITPVNDENTNIMNQENLEEEKSETDIAEEQEIENPKRMPLQA